jgi:hypothetical protein
MKQFIGHWGLSPALPGRTALMSERSLSRENGYDYADLEVIMSLPVHGAWMNSRGPGHTLQRIEDDTETVLVTDQFCVEEPELSGFVLVTAERADAEMELDHATFTYNVYGTDSRKPIATARVTGRTGLYKQYETLVGYRPDDNGRYLTSIRELLSSVGSALLFDCSIGQ